MAGFNPKTSVDSGREYDFKGAQPNDALGILLKGSASAVGDFIESEYKVVNKDIQDNARAQVEAGQESLFPAHDIAASQSASVEGGIAPPEDLTRGFDKVSKYKNAYEKGALTESDFLANVDVTVRNLRSRYGHQWANEIDAAVQNAVSNSANNYRKQLFSEWDSKKSAADKAAEKERTDKLNWVQQNAIYLKPSTVQNWESFGIEELMLEAQPLQVGEQNVKNLNAALELKRKQGEDTKETAEQSMSATTNQVVATVINSGNLFELGSKIRNNPGNNAEAKDQYLNYVGEARARLEFDLRKKFTEPQFASLGRDTVEKYVQQGLDQLKIFEKAFDDEKYGLLALEDNRLKSATTDAMTKAMQNDPKIADGVVLNKAIDKMGLSIPLSEAITNHFANDEGFFSSIADGNAVKAASNVIIGNKTLADTMRMISSAKADPKVLGSVVRTVKDIVLSPKTPDEVKGDIVKRLFDPNDSIMSAELATPGLATTLFNDFVSPTMVKQMIALKSSDNVAWTHYIDFVTDQSFNAIFRNELATVSPEIQGLNNIKFDPNKRQFSFTPSRTDFNGLKVTNTWEKNTVRTLQRLNYWIANVEPLVKAQYGSDSNVTEEMIRILEQSPLAAEGMYSGKGSFGGKILKVLSNSAAKQDVEETKTP